MEFIFDTLGSILIVTLVSFGAAFFWGRWSLWIGLPCAVVFPCLVTWPVYWLPLMNVRDTSEYSAWYGVAAIMWLMLAWPVSVATTVLVRLKMRHRKDQS